MNVQPALLALLLAAVAVQVAVAKEGWTCNEDGYWYENGVKSDYDGCKSEEKGEGKSSDLKKDGKETSSCTRSNDPAMADYPKACILGPPDDGPRCWWYYIPDNVKALDSSTKVPLLIDMHGGGGCASHEASSSGFKEVAKSLPGKDSFIIVWPQGYEQQWGTCGADCGSEQAENKGKEVASQDDVTFLTHMISFVLKSSEAANVAMGKVDAERIYATGFSMGCMMSHRIALERSKIIAGFGCHGGRMIGLGNDIAAERKRFDVQPMPAYLTGGDQDPWFQNTTDLDDWADMNGCSNTTTTESIELDDTDEAESKVTRALLTIRSSGCTEAVTVARLELSGLDHRPDSRVAPKTWEFLKSFKRIAAIDEIGAPESGWIDEVDKSAGSMTSIKITYCMCAAVMPLLWLWSLF